MNGLGEDEIVAGMASDPSCLTQARAGDRDGERVIGTRARDRDA